MTSNESEDCDPQDVVNPPRKRGAPTGNRNRFKTGRYSKPNRAFRRDIAALKREVRETVLLAEAARQAQDR